jgi:hypothetical protein
MEWKKVRGIFVVVVVFARRVLRCWRGCGKGVTGSSAWWIRRSPTFEGV